MALKKAATTDTTAADVAAKEKQALEAKEAQRLKDEEAAAAEANKAKASEDDKPAEAVEAMDAAEAQSELVDEAAAAASGEPTDGAAAQLETGAVHTAEPVAQAVAVRGESTNVAVVGEGERARGAMKAYISQELAQEGFEDLELTGFSFDRIKLHEGKFKLGTEEVDLGEEFDCIIHSTRAIYVVRQSTDEDSEVYYSYDPEGKTLSDGSSAEEVLEKWRDEGYATEENPVDVKKYLEVMVTLTNRDDEYNDTMASLSIPPASRDRLAGAAAMAKQKYKVSPSGVITRCKVGKKTGEGKKAFRPWVFQVQGLVG